MSNPSLTMKSPSLKSSFFRLMIRHPLFNRPAIHTERSDNETNDGWSSSYNTAKSSWWQPILKFLYSIPNSVGSLFTSLIHDWHEFIQTNEQGSITTNVGEYENRKIVIIKQLNLFQLFTGIIVPFSIFFSQNSVSLNPVLVYLFPPIVNFSVLYLVSRRRKLAAMIAYFALYPFFTNLAYIDNFSLGTELFFVLYGILSVFFLQQTVHILFCIGFNMVNYLMLLVMLKNYQVQHDTNHPFFFLLNHLIAVAVIFYSLYLIKKENAGYQASMLAKNNELQLINEEVKKQKEEIVEKANQLEEQTKRLNEIDAFKTRLFSIVSHDLKGPLHALRNLFVEIRQQNMSAKEIREFVPDVIEDLTNATGLTDNLLNWARSQMHAQQIFPQVVNVAKMIDEVMQQQKLQAELKNIQVNKNIQEDLFIYADSDMIKLVMRNILSNAIKFTSNGGVISIGTNAVHAYVEIFIEDTGDGMDTEALHKIRTNNYFTTKGTANEHGTGLGIMLCKDFLEKNNGQLHIESTKGKGSIFSFTLPRTNNFL